MKDLEMNKIIAWGLIVMGIMSIGGWIAHSILAGTSTGTEIPLSISSGLLGVLTGKNLQNKTSATKKRKVEKK